jgi:diguanylate cyclase (GGDEF)-like protein
LQDAISWSDLELRRDFIVERLGLNWRERLGDLDQREKMLEFIEELREIDGRNAVRIIAEAAARYRPRGITPDHRVDAATLASMLNVAFDFESLESDPIYWHMRDWERHNYRFPLLKVWRALDPLGVVWDQRYWEADLETFLRLYHVDGIAAFKMDLDNFREVNKVLGHGGGDEALREYLLSVRTRLGQFAEVYRRGGDEVVAFAPGLKFADAKILAEQVRTDIESRFSAWGTARGLTAYPTASIGVVEVAGGMTFAEVSKRMDAAQQTAKDGGKNRVVAWEATSLPLA